MLCTEPSEIAFLQVFFTSLLPACFVSHLLSNVQSCLAWSYCRKWCRWIIDLEALVVVLINSEKFSYESHVIWLNVSVSALTSTWAERRVKKGERAAAEEECKMLHIITCQNTLLKAIQVILLLKWNHIWISSMDYYIIVSTDTAFGNPPQEESCVILFKKLMMFFFNYYY